MFTQFVSSHIRLATCVSLVSAYTHSVTNPRDLSDVVSITAHDLMYQQQQSLLSDPTSSPTLDQTERSAIPSLEDFLALCPMICTSQWHFELSEFDSPAHCIKSMCGDQPPVSLDSSRLTELRNANATHSISLVLRQCRPMCESEWWLDSLPFFETIDDCYNQICPKRQAAIAFNNKFDHRHEANKKLVMESDAKAISRTMEASKVEIKQDSTSHGVDRMVKKTASHVKPVHAKVIQAILDKRLKSAKTILSTKTQVPGLKSSGVGDATNVDTAKEQAEKSAYVQSIQSHVEEASTNTPMGRTVTRHSYPTPSIQSNNKMVSILQAAAMKMKESKQHIAQRDAAVSSCTEHKHCPSEYFCSRQLKCQPRVQCGRGSREKQPVNGLCPRS